MSGAKYFELSNIIPAVQIGHSVPDSLIDSFKTFQHSRYIEKTVPSALDFISKEYHVSVMINEDWTMGGVAGIRAEYSDSTQKKVGTIYWNSSETGSLAWLMVPSARVQSVSVSETEMRIWRIDGEKGLTLFINGKDFDTSYIISREWDMPGISMTPSVDPSLISAEVINSKEFGTEQKVDGSLDTVIKVQCEATELTLSINDPVSA